MMSTTALHPRSAASDLEPLQREVAGVVVHVREFLDLASPRQDLESAHEPSPDSQGVRDVADHEMPGLVARVDLAEQVLPGAGRREERTWRPPSPSPRIRWR